MKMKIQIIVIQIVQIQQQRKILDNKYILKKQIGYGAQGEVYLVVKIEDNKEYVAKLRTRI